LDAASQRSKQLAPAEQNSSHGIPGVMTPEQSTSHDPPAAHVVLQAASAMHATAQ
jgi:hypothetical protein